MAETGEDVEKAAALLMAGQLVGIPTETVYGLAGNALNEKAILEIYKVKNRPRFDPLIAHIGSVDALAQYVEDIPAPAQRIAEAFWPGPVTLLLPKKKIIPDLLTSGLPTVAVRIPDHPLTLELLAALDFPLAAPSANPFGYVSPTTARHVYDQLGSKIPYILDGGSCEVGIESTIIGFDNAQNPVIYRLGGKKVEDLEAITGRVKLQLNHSSNPLAPGMLKTHYAPAKRLLVGKLTDLLPRHLSRRVGIISFSHIFDQVPPGQQIALSPQRDLDEAASRLFSALRAMDRMDIDLILAEKFPDQGLGKAINDRLARAAAR